MPVNELKKFFLENDNFIVTAHEAPDADAVGAVISLFNILSAIDKHVQAGFAEAIPEKYKFMDPYNNLKNYKDPGKTVQTLRPFHLIVLDTVPTNIGKMSKFRDAGSCRTIITIDHHDIHIPESGINWQNEEASSTCEMLYELFSAFAITPDLHTSQALFSGIVYDTGSFVYPKTTENTFQIAHNLVSLGVNPNNIYSRLFQSKSVAALLLQSKILNTLRLYCQDRIAVQQMSVDFLEDTGATYEEAQENINIPLQSLNIIVSIFLKENENRQKRCSLRSKGQIDCAAISRSFGGGGHKTAAGFKFTESFESIKDKLLDILGPMLP